MPPSPQDWLILIRNGFQAAFVITREGMYKFWWGEEAYAEIREMNPMEAPAWVAKIIALEHELNLVHRGVLSIADYKKVVSKYHMHMEIKPLDVA